MELSSCPTDRHGWAGRECGGEMVRENDEMGWNRRGVGDRGQRGEKKRERAGQEAVRVSGNRSRRKREGGREGGRDRA